MHFHPLHFARRAPFPRTVSTRAAWFGFPVALPLILAVAVFFLGYSAIAANPKKSGPVRTDSRLAREILEDPDLRQVQQRARELLKTGLNAGSGYGEIWIRDLNTFIEIALEVNERGPIRDSLLTFLKFQGPSGDIPDGYIPKKRGSAGYKYRASALSPDFLAHKNTVETDQETSLVQAVRKYVAATGDRTLLDERINGKRLLDRLEEALIYVMTERFDTRFGLAWGATTVDWGDVQPEHEWGVELDASSHRTIDIYDNAMLAIAIEDYLKLLPAGSPGVAEWKRKHALLKRNIRKHLWDSRNGKFIPHIYLESSPFPPDFDERAIHYHGGTAVAIEAGILKRAEIKQVLEAMRANVQKAGASSIGLTVYPVYPAGYFKNKSMGPYSYQNGGDWCWFGGRMIQQLIRYDLVPEAFESLRPMVTRVIRHGDFYEWWSLDNQPRGSKQYRGSAGVLGVAIRDLQSWARKHQGPVQESTPASPQR